MCEMTEVSVKVTLSFSTVAITVKYCAGLAYVWHKYVFAHILVSDSNTDHALLYLDSMTPAYQDFPDSVRLQIDK
jgi:hypothetical protein